VYHTYVYEAQTQKRTRDHYALLRTIIQTWETIIPRTNNQQMTIGETNWRNQGYSNCSFYGLLQIEVIATTNWIYCNCHGLELWLVTFWIIQAVTYKLEVIVPTRHIKHEEIVEIIYSYCNLLKKLAYMMKLTSLKVCIIMCKKMHTFPIYGIFQMW
jgi:hypothetical protein